jgi:phosphoglycerate dehydrogenase-like enzyme
MSEGFRVLVSCPQAWDGLEEFGDRFAQHGIKVDVPEVRGQAMTEADLFTMIGDYDGILAGDDELTRKVIEAAPKLKVISKWGVGVDSIDHQAAAERNIVIMNTPGVFGDELADYALGYMLLIARRQHEVDQQVRTGVWYKPRGHSLAGRALGVVGMGDSGRALAVRALAMRMEVIGTDPFADETAGDVPLLALEDLFGKSDVISLHLPLSSETELLIDSAAISKMRRGVWLINTSRGGLVDEQALADGLETGQIGAAALDVFRTEPIDPSNPLLHHPNVIVGSHNGSNTNEAVERTTRLAVENLIVGLMGEA